MSYNITIRNLTRMSKFLIKHCKGLEHRDDNIYRVVLGAEPIDKSVRDAGVGGFDRYADIKAKDILHEDIVIDSARERVDRLRRKLYIESKSQDEVVALAENKGEIVCSYSCHSTDCQ